MILAAIVPTEGTGYLVIPVVGPFILVGRSSTSAPSDCHNDACGIGQFISTVLDVFLVIDGIVQAVGVALIIAGAVKHQTVYKLRRISFQPTVSPRFTGLSLAFRF